MNQAKCDGVGAHTEGTPFFRNGLRHAYDCGLGCSIVDLTNIAVQTGG